MPYSRNRRGGYDKKNMSFNVGSLIGAIQNATNTGDFKIEDVPVDDGTQSITSDSGALPQVVNVGGQSFTMPAQQRAIVPNSYWNPSGARNAQAFNLGQQKMQQDFMLDMYKQGLLSEQAYQDAIRSQPIDVAKTAGIPLGSAADVQSFSQRGYEPGVQNYLSGQEAGLAKNRLSTFNDQEALRTAQRIAPDVYQKNVVQAGVDLDKATLQGRADLLGLQNKLSELQTLLEANYGKTTADAIMQKALADIATSQATQQYPMVRQATPGTVGIDVSKQQPLYSVPGYVTGGTTIETDPITKQLKVQAGGTTLQEPPKPVFYNNGNPQTLSPNAGQQGTTPQLQQAGPYIKLPDGNLYDTRTQQIVPRRVQ